MAQFRTKARAVDLMGKGQIADLPTAISELWKNGYDAYGDTLQAHLFEQGYKDNNPPLFVLTDDGKGMSGDDITDKWFVLGTDSKSRNTSDKEGPETLFKKPRVKMGEKGIGRLAVAYLGPQMLLVTKKMNEPVQLVFFDWRILENYNLFLDDVSIPQHTLTSRDSFSGIFEGLKKDLLRNFEISPGKKDPWEEQKELRDQIINECKSLTVPEFAADRLFSDLLASFSSTHATRFLIFHPDIQITTLRDFTKADSEEDESTQNYAISTLAGLFNLFKTKTPEYKTHFWIYEKGKGPYDLLTLRSFFDPEDFELCDHMIEGDFNSNGSFDGQVRIYKEKVAHRFNEHRVTKTTYGPFRLKIGYVQKEKEDSSLTEEVKKAFEDKLNIYSGVFIYRDGFKVLPYGRPDTDFLEFEERRSKGAGTYFFSNRRMFGYIEISRNENGRLKDKSSREGLTNNQAYRDFKMDLIAFFKDLAKKYFATKAELDYKRDQQKELKKLAEAEEQEKAKETAARKDFADKLRSLPKELETLEKEYDGYIEELEIKSGQSESIYQDLQNLMNKAERCKIRINDMKLNRPTRFKPTETQTKNYHNYNRSYQKVSEHLAEAEPILQKVKERLQIHELFQSFEEKHALYNAELRSQFDDQSRALEEILKGIRLQFDSEKQLLLDEFNDKYVAIIPARDNVDEINKSMLLLENLFNGSKERLTERVTPYINHIRRLDFNVDEDSLVGYYKLKFEEMKEEWNQTYELAQLGIAVEIIDHQFNALYAQLAENIKTLPEFMISGPVSEEKYKNLQTAFEHLQNNYKLLQPIYRTTGRIRKDVTGPELEAYTRLFFDKRFSADKIDFRITPAGKKWSHYTYESVIKPVIINIVNNALYWLRHSPQKEIVLDARNDELLILNTGDPIDDYLLEDIFKLFFSKRPNGRGIGLYLAKRSLNSAGMDIYATNDHKYNTLGGACFVIKPITKNNE